MTTMEITITMNRIDADGTSAELPDADSEVLVYDAVLDDTVIGYYSEAFDDGPEGMTWIDSATGERLPRPEWWAEKPYPAED